MSIVPALAAVALAAGPAPVVQQFDFPFPPCLGVQAADNPFHVTTVSDPGLPAVHTVTAHGWTVSVFRDAGTYRALPSRAGDRIRAGRYTDGYLATASGHVKLDPAGAIATADRLDETRVITLWDGHRPFFREIWQIHVDGYDENVTQPQVTDNCLS